MACHYTARLFLYNQQVMQQNHTDVVKNKFYPVSALAATLQNILQVLWTLVCFFFFFFSNLVILKTSMMHIISSFYKVLLYYYRCT